MAIFSRLPKLQQLLPVYAVIVMMTYGWTLLWFLWKVPSWMYFLSLVDIFGIFAYTLAIDFLESLAILLLLVVICLFLPRKWFYDSFVIRGSASAILFLGYLMYFSYSFKTIEVKDYPQALANWTPVIGALILGLVFLFGKIGLLGKAVEELSLRAVIFLYISIPISTVALLYVVVRNLYFGFLNG